MNPGSTAKISAVAIALAVALARQASAASSLSFPATHFAILDADTHAAIGNSVYQVDETPEGGTLHGLNNFFDKQVDVETSHLEAGVAGEGPTLADFDHTFYKADGSILIRGYFNLKTGAATCVDNSNGHSRTRSMTLSVPENTWAGASVVVPIQGFLRAGDEGTTQSLHVFSCAPGPEIIAVTVQIDQQSGEWQIYGGKAVRVEIKPDFGLITPLIASFVPKLRAWFDPNGWGLVGDEAARWYKGPRVMLVKAAGAK
jgi:hypothetical protein